MKKNIILKNSFISIFFYLSTVILNLISRRFFLNYLNIELLGLSTLFSSLVQLLSITELGFGTAIVFHLYRPFYNNNRIEVNKLLNYLKSIYFFLALIICFLGTLIVFFVDKFMPTSSSISPNIIRITFALFLIETIIPFFFQHKKSLIFIDQKFFIINIIEFIFFSISLVVKIFVLVFFQNYILFVFIQVLTKLLTNLFFLRYSNKNYNNYFKVNSKPNILKRKSIKKLVLSTFIARITGFIVHYTDSFLISFYSGLVVLALYSNYYLILSIGQNIINKLTSSISASLGELISNRNKDDLVKVFENYYSHNFLVSLIISVFIVNLSNSFLKLWIGESYIIDLDFPIYISIYFFLYSLTRLNGNFIDNSGMANKLIKINIFESLSNIILSISLGSIWGLKGVILGTIITWFIVNILVQNKINIILLEKRLKFHSIKQFLFSGFGIISILISYGINNQLLLFTNINLFGVFLLSFLICFLICLSLIALFYFTNYHVKNSLTKYILKLTK